MSLKVIFHLPLRATEGLLGSLVELMELPIKVPDYTTLSRRQSKLAVEIPSFIPNGSRHIVIDSTGLKVRVHGYDNRRTWRKLHLGIDEKTQEIVAYTLTTNDIKDSQVFGKLLAQIEEPINQVLADGAYGSFECYQEMLELEAQPVIPPNAVERTEYF